MPCALGEQITAWKGILTYGYTKNISYKQVLQQILQAKKKRCRSYWLRVRLWPAIIHWQKAGQDECVESYRQALFSCLTAKHKYTTELSVYPLRYKVLRFYWEGCRGTGWNIIYPLKECWEPFLWPHIDCHTPGTPALLLVMAHITVPSYKANTSVLPAVFSGQQQHKQSCLQNSPLCPRSLEP